MPARNPALCTPGNYSEISKMSAIVRFWLGITIGFEAITLYRVGHAGEKIPDVQPMYQLVPKAHQPDSSHFLFLVATLAVIRLAQLMNARSKGAWAITALVHTLEAAFYSWLIFGVTAANRSLKVSADYTDLKTQGIIIYAIVVFNALLFTGTWLMTPSTPKAVAVAAAGGRSSGKPHRE